MLYDWLGVARDLAATIAAWQACEPLLAVALYAAVLFGASVTGLLSPSLVELAGAAVLGFWPALLAGLPTAALGAMLPFAVARARLGPWLARRFPKFHRLVETGVGRDGPLFLLTLRLMPGVPFLATNLFMGLTPVRGSAFFALTLILRLPMTALLCNAGNRLGQARGMDDLVAPPTVAAFAALAMAPLLLRLAWRKILKSRR
jgi:uncharacterized membrane protein YdjX (TVP38/TMEM64 family)